LQVSRVVDGLMFGRETKGSAAQTYMHPGGGFSCL
jgi:hypothetical protein